jgi:hypothetical protein
MSLVLGDRVLDNGLSVLDLECDALYVCHTQPTSYIEATSTYALGSKAVGVGGVYGAPADETTIGRKVISVAVANGGSVASGTPVAWAAVDTVKGRLLASGPLTGGVPFTAGGFNLSDMTIVQPFGLSASLPLNLTPPEVSGVVIDGVTLNSTTGMWRPDPGLTYTFEWFTVLTDENGVPLTDDNGEVLGAVIPGATASYHEISGIPVTQESTWNFYDTTIGALFPDLDNLRILTCSPQHACVRGTRANTTGKRYFELKFDEISASSVYNFPGICGDDHVLTIAVYPGSTNTKGSVMYMNVSGGPSSLNANLGGYGYGVVPWADGDVIGFACDLDARKIWASRNGVWLGLAGTDPATDTNGLYWGAAARQAMKPYVELDYGPSQLTLNTGATPFAYSPPTGYIAWEAP